MSEEHPEKNNSDLENAVRLHGVVTPATKRVEKGVFEKIREYEQEKSFDERFQKDTEKDHDGLDAPEM